MGWMQYTPTLFVAGFNMGCAENESLFTTVGNLASALASFH